MRKTSIKTLIRLANGLRVTSTEVCDVSFILTQHEFDRTFLILRDLRVADVVLGLP
jgi:hypothetical protein